MTSAKLFSYTEHKILLTLVFTICCVFYGNFAAILIEDYNQKVIAEQTKKRDLADNPSKSDKISFGFSCYNSTPIYSILFWLQFFSNPFLYFFSKKHSVKNFISSVFLTSVSFLSLIMWNISTYIAISYAEQLPDNFKFNDYVLYDSTLLELALYPLFAILFAIQMFFLLRFVLENNQVKISLK